jgi:predicted O-linked N-acetylglucosamine transferase (SPINDLY family)
MPTIPEALQLGLQHHQAGNLAEAERIYRQILQADPREPDAWHRLGLIAYQVGKFDAAVEAITRAIELREEDAAYHSNLGLAYEGLGRMPEALVAYRRAVKTNRNWAQGHFLLGCALSRDGRLPEAVLAFREAVRLAPQHAPYHNELGIALGKQGIVEESAECFRQATRLKPEFAEAYNNLGNIRVAQGRFDEAIGRYRKAIEVKPNYHQAYGHLGVALAKQGKVADAIPYLDRAVEIEPRSSEVHNNLGNALLVAGYIGRAQAAFERALQLDPNHPASASNRLLTINYDPAIDPDRIADEHRAWGARLAARIQPISEHPNDPDPERVIRVGYVSADFRKHPVASFMLPIIEHGDRSQMQAILVADAVVPDPVTERLRSLADGWHDTTGMNDVRVREIVERERIDILVDLAGHTANNRLGLFAMRPAPVQVSYLGYPSTTGLPAIDYALTDAVVDPPGEERHFSEELVRLPLGFCTFAPPPDAPEVSELPALQTGRFTYGSLHNLPKLNRSVLDLWAKVIQQHPGSRLLLVRNAFDPGTREHYRAQLLELGLTDEQFEFRDQIPAAGHLQVYQEIDIALDPFPWSGHTSACEAMWMGVPTVTLLGNRHAGRMVASVLTRVGLEDWIAKDAGEYLAIAAKFSNSLDDLAALRRQLRERMLASPLGQGAAFCRTLADAYRDMWRRWCAKRA